MTEPEAPLGKYMYCIIRCAAPRQFTCPGIGEEGAPVHTVHFGDLAAVVSDSPVVEYDRARRYMLAHELVLEEVMQEFTLLPVRFGVVAPRVEAIREQVLGRRHDELTALLAGLEGKVELGLKAISPEGLFMQEIVAEAPPAMRRLRDKIQGKSVEESYYDRLSLGEMIEAEMGKKRDEAADKILSRLLPLADDYKLNALHLDRMVLNAAFLVQRNRQHEFDAAVQHLDAEMGERLNFKYVGPVPPYNFVSVTITWDQ